MIVDAHAHAFLSAADDPERTVDEIAPADRAAPVEALESVMAANDVSRAVLLPLGPEDGYVGSVVRERPEVFKGIAVDDPTLRDPHAVTRRVTGGGFSGLRMFALPEADRDRWQALAAALAAEDLVLWMYPRPQDVMAVDELAARHPGLRIVLNHSGLTQSGIGVDDAGRPRITSTFPQPTLGAVVRLARHEQIAVVLSGAYGFSHLPYPYDDVADHVRHVAEAFTPSRLMWASDFPWPLAEPGYEALLRLVDHHLPGLSPDERADVLGGTCCRVLRWEHP